MKSFSTVLARHDALLLVFCAMLFGVAYGLGYERGLVPTPGWYTPSLHRFCLILMAWTALMHSDPVQRLVWSVTDFVALTLHFFAGSVLVPTLPLPYLVEYWVALGKIAAAACFGVAVTQGIYSLLPGWRVAITRRLPSRAAARDELVAQDEPPVAAPPAPASSHVRHIQLSHQDLTSHLPLGMECAGAPN